jgi:hypothetical protein
VLTFGVDGAVSSTPSLAAAGRTVALVWTATIGSTANLYFASSRDGGATFSTPKRVNDRDGDAGATTEQPPRVVISGQPAAPVFTVIWSQRDPGPQQARRDVLRMARSTDGGRTFSPARVTHDEAFGGARGWESVAAAADGTIHAVWLDGRNASQKIAEMAKHGMAHQGQPPQEVYHGTLSSNGRMVETLIASDVCFCCKTSLAIGRGGNVYAAWRHVFPGSIRDIAFAKSTDSGRRFGALVRVSEDRWELNGCPEDGPSMAVDASGTIHIAWATLVTDGVPRKAVFYATSTDGTTFSPRKLVPAMTDNPGHPQLTLLADGGVAIVFDEIATGLRRVSLARTNRSGVFLPTRVISGDESAAFPVIARSGSDLLVAWTSRPAKAQPSDRSQIHLARVG